MKYAEIRHQIQTGDLVLFSGQGFFSDIIRFGQRLAGDNAAAEWSHVGLAVRSDEWDQVVLWESTTLSKIPDIMFGRAVRGVQQVFLSARLATYEGRVGVRYLTAERTPERLAALRQLRREFAGRPYEQDRLELARAAIGHIGPESIGEEDLTTLFCSELVAEAYQCMGLLGPDRPSNRYSPAHFAGELPLVDGSLGTVAEIEP